MYTISFEPGGYRVLKKLPKDVREKLLSKADILKTNPLAGKQLVGVHRFFRSLHVGHKGVQYRIIYQVFSETKTIIIRLADTRENIYRRLEHMGN